MGQESRAITGRRFVYEVLDGSVVETEFERYLNIGLAVLIVMNSFAVVIESMAGMHAKYHTFFHGFEATSLAIFAIEYLLRVWSCVESADYGQPIKGRLRFALTPLALVDLVIFLPYMLPFFGAADLRIVRMFRLLRLGAVFKLGRYSRSLRLFKAVLVDRKEELAVTSLVMVLLAIVGASAIYAAENAAQPDKFPDIPSAMWWAVVTLTTVGYGDVYPITPAGKFVAALFSTLGIAFFALPAGILGAGFVEALRERKEREGGVDCLANEDTVQTCPHCGRQWTS